MFSNVESFFLTLTFTLACGAERPHSIFHCLLDWAELAWGSFTFSGPRGQESNLCSTSMNRKSIAVTVIDSSAHLVASSSWLSPGSVSGSSLLSSHPESSLCAALTAWVRISRDIIIIRLLHLKWSRQKQRKEIMRISLVYRVFHIKGPKVIAYCS